MNEGLPFGRRSTLEATNEVIYKQKFIFHALGGISTWFGSRLTGEVLSSVVGSAVGSTVLVLC